MSATTTRRDGARSGIGVAACREIAAPCDVVWDILTDIEGRPRHLSRVRSVERLDGSAPGTFAVGTKFRAVWDAYVVVLTVTSISDGASESEYPKSITYVSHQANIASRAHSSTTTVTVEPVTKDGKNVKECCRLFTSVAIMPRGILGHLSMAACFCRCQRKALRYIQIDLDDIAKSAEEKI